jgi:hypothetical protein
MKKIKNNEIVDDSWIGQNVICTIEGLEITDAKITGKEGFYAYGICQNVISGADDGDHLGYDHVWRIDIEVENLKLVSSIKFNFMDIVKEFNTGLYYVIASEMTDDNMYVCYSIKGKGYLNISATKLRLSSFEEACKFSPTHALIKSVEDSIKLFDFGERKKPSLGKHLEFIKYSSQFSITAVVLVYPGVNIHGNWCTSDVELTIVLPDISLQNYKKDLTVKVDDTVRLINNKKLPFEKNVRCQVIKITTSVNNKYTIKNTTNSPLDVVYLKNLSTGRIQPTYMKNVKKIINA